MKSLVLRSFCLLAVSLLAACQSTPKSAEPVRQDLSQAFQQFEHTLEQGDIDGAERQLKLLQENASSATELEQSQRLLADAYLQLGQQALQQGNVDAAASALSRARSLLPRAPALTRGLNTAIAHANSQVIALPELDDEASLYPLLDRVANNIVKAKRSVRIEVRDSQDVARLTGLLDSRVKQLNPDFNVLYSAEISPEQSPRLILLPGS